MPGTPPADKVSKVPLRNLGCARSHRETKHNLEFRQKWALKGRRGPLIFNERTSIRSRRGSKEDISPQNF